MAVYKPRTEPEELIILKALNKRMTLSEKDSQHYFRLKKGYEGEVIFDELTEKLQCECFILNDLLLKVNNTTFQIDTLIIFSKKVYFYEVKNFEGNYYYDSESDRLYKLPKTEYNNPIHQVNRSESLLRQLFQNLGVNLPIDGNGVFINPKFTLYQAPLDKPFIFPTQIENYLEKLETMPSKLNENHKALADKLISLHIKKSPYTQLPPYEYEQLRKGITCEICNSFEVLVHGRKCICGDCGHEELVTTAVLRSVREYQLLFPNRKITTNIIYEWCSVIDLKKTVRRVLEKNFKKVGVHQWTYYE